MGTLYLVSTPIGNLEDITQRALRVLREASLIAAEDTRTARILLSAYGITTPVVSYHEQGGQPRVEPILQRLQGGDVALISEAGTPGISDPGFELVHATLAAGHQVVPVPGPSALTAALAVAGVPLDQFTYVGFLPRRRAQRRRLLGELAASPRTSVAFEAPHRLRAALEDMAEALGLRPLAVCRELTKLHEEVFRGTPEEALAHFQQPRGEFTLVFAGAPAEDRRSATGDSAALRRRLGALRRQGLRAREAVGQVAVETGVSRRLVYQEWLRLSPPRTPA
ncbi:MAG: 16S rRNA (cytidine(1402)-2'-O)-methyltransferase [Dehalococcoidia bacterium]|nr:16S rRNA (cytidine(1402)-2'-O)-methyltransferase [Dehalococcoidia bacterium]